MGKIPFISSYDVEKGKGIDNNSEKGHDNNSSTSKSPSKSRVQSSNKSDYGTPSDGEVLSTCVGKSYSQDPDLNVGLILPNSEPPHPIVRAQKNRIAKKKQHQVNLVMRFWPNHQECH
jgi:hypothetical protein